MGAKRPFLCRCAISGIAYNSLDAGLACHFGVGLLIGLDDGLLELIECVRGHGFARQSRIFMNGDLSDLQCLLCAVEVHPSEGGAVRLFRLDEFVAVCGRLALQDGVSEELAWAHRIGRDAGVMVDHSTFFVRESGAECPFAWGDFRGRLSGHGVRHERGDQRRGGEDVVAHACLSGLAGRAEAAFCAFGG